MCQQALSITKDIILTCSAMIGSYVALKGLNTWQRQLKGQADYNLAKRLLVSLFRFRDALNNVRHPGMYGHEMPIPSEEERRIMSSEQVRHYGVSGAYQARWDKVQTERASLYADLIESEALWGAELNDLFKRVFELEKELHTTIMFYLKSIDPGNNQEDKQAFHGVYNKRRNIMYDTLDNEDEYKKDLKMAIEKIEAFLKPKLSR